MLRISLFAGLFAFASFASAQEKEPILPTVNERIRESADNAPLSMQFTGKTAEDCRKWQAEFSAKLRSLLGPHQPPKEWKTVVEKRTEKSDHVLTSLVLYSDGHPPLPLYLLVPKNAGKKKLPGIVAIHGHGNYGYDPVAGRDDLLGVDKAIKNANYDYGRQLVKRGYVVVCPCLTPFGRRLGKRESYGKQDPCAITYLRLQLFGKVLIAENLRDCLWATEFLARHNNVDPERLGCVGLSYGGRMTMLTAALEPRFKVAVISGALNVMQERVSVRYSCGAQIIPGLLQYGDVPEISSLIAPRYCVWEVGSRDGLMKSKWVDVGLKRIERAYEAYGKRNHLKVDRFSGGHRWNGEVAIPLLDRELNK